MKSKASTFGENIIKNFNKSENFNSEIIVQSNTFSLKISPISKSKNKTHRKKIRILEDSYSYNTSDNLAKIDFDNCKKILINIYNISSEDKIIMKQMEFNSKINIEKLDDSTQSNSTSFEFYNIENSEKLDTSYCKNISIPISISIPKSNRLNMNLYALSTKFLEGTDIYNVNSPSFHSRCFKSFDFNTAADISINARRTKLYQNESMNCSPGCDYKGLDEERKVVCDCTELDKSELSNNRTLEDLFKMPSMNFDISLCYNTVFLNVIIFYKHPF